MWQRRVWLVMLMLCVGMAACQNSDGQQVTVSPIPSATATLTPQELTGQTIKGTTAPVYRLMENGELRHIRDWATFLALDFDPLKILELAPEALTPYSLGSPLTRWLAGEQDQTLYFIHNGQRHLISDAQTLQMTGGSVRNIVQVPDDYLANFPLASETLTVTARYIPPPPAITAATWWQGSLWLASEAGGVRRWQNETWQTIDLPESITISSFAPGGDTLYAADDSGTLWQFNATGDASQFAETGLRSIAALVVRPEGGFWAADVDFYDLDTASFQRGQGVVQILADGTTESLNDAEALHDVSEMAYDAATSVLWIATRHAGLFRYDVMAQRWQHFTTLNSPLPDNIINDLAWAVDGTLWLASEGGIVQYHNDIFILHSPAVALALTVANDSAVWFAGNNLVGKLGEFQYTTFDHPALRDPFTTVMLDEAGNPWLVRRHNIVHFDGAQWVSYDMNNGSSQTFIPGEPQQAPVLDFPSPLTDYNAYLQTWPRPPADNGRCIHYLRHPAGDDFETWYQITRLEQLGVRWVLVNYVGHEQLLQLAPIFAQTDIMVIWRPFVRPYQVYEHWRDDVVLLRALGLPPYIQLYNEPNLDQEWDGQAINQELFLSHLLPAIEQVYAAGGYVGIQEFDLEWARTTLQRLKSADLEYIFNRLFFVAHAYGANHPPDFTEDEIGVLGFLEYAQVFEEEIGFVPMTIAGEGGWLYGNQADTRYPPIGDDLHRDYHVAVFDWFRTGLLSNNAPLPDYFFAFCPWLLADPGDPYAWFDSPSGDRILTIEAVEAMEPFERRFSWLR